MLFQMGNPLSTKQLKMGRVGDMTEEEAEEKMRAMRPTPKQNNEIPSNKIVFKEKIQDTQMQNNQEKKDPWYLKPLLFVFVIVVTACMISMCNHALKESSGVGIETTIKSHGD